ncbi:MAG: mycothiol synthase [Acidimicrobiales bacterium]
MDRIEVTRRAGVEDAAGIATLLAAAAEALGHRPLDDDSWLALVAGRRSGFAGFVARPEDGTTILGYAQLDREPGSWGLAYVLDPAGDDAPAIGRVLCRAALDLVGEEGGGHVQLWIRSPTATSDEVASSVGLARGRKLHRMRRPLPVEEETSPPIATRPFRVGLDEHAWLETNNRAFASHPDQGYWSRGTLVERERQPWFDPEGFLVHEIDGKIAAFCWTKVHGGDPPLGEIYVLGVDPAVQGRGIGRRMLHAGLAWLSAKGLRAVILYVDTDNPRAVELYRALGFVVDRDDRAYVVEVEPSR